MRKLFLILALGLLLVGCTNYKYEYEVEVVYNNGDWEVLKFGRESFNGNEVYLYMETSAGGVLSESGTSPCLVMACGARRKTIACGLRRYKILKIRKTEIE